jgi:hypothetical protein
MKHHDFNRLPRIGAISARVTGIVSDLICQIGASAQGFFLFAEIFPEGRFPDIQRRHTVAL